MLAVNQQEGESSEGDDSMRSIIRVLVVLCLFSTLHFMTPAAFATKISMPTLVTEPTNRTKISMPTLVTEPTNRTKISMPTLLRQWGIIYPTLLRASGINVFTARKPGGISIPTLLTERADQEDEDKYANEQDKDQHADFTT